MQNINPFKTREATMRFGFVLVLLLAAALQAGEPATVKSGLIVDLDADRGVELQAGKVVCWKNQVDWKAQDFLGKRDNGRPSFRKAVAELGGHDALVFQKQELVNYDEDAFDHLTTGSGYTWVVVLAVARQLPSEDLNCFFGNLKNGGVYEGFWGGLNDDNTLWIGSRNGVTFDRGNPDNPKVLGPKLAEDRFYVVAGRMGAGTDDVSLELFVGGPAPVASKVFPVNPKANASKMAIGQERDATNHPGRESFNGQIARILFWERPLTDAELKAALEQFEKAYAITPGTAADPGVLAANPAVRADDVWPFDAAEAPRRQALAAKALNLADPLEIPLADPPGTVLKFRLIPTGKFELGSPAAEAGHESDEALHPEIVAAPFYMQETQLTLEAYRALLHADPPGTPADADPQLPAAVSYRDAVDNLLPAVAKIAPAGWQIILPDRVRLEYAARAGAATMNHGGNREADADAYAWSSANSGGKVHPVGQKKPNAWGLFDTLGNRWHWYWSGPGADGDASRENHLVYGGAYHTPAAGNGARLANIMVSRGPEGVRFALIRTGAPLPQGHPETGASPAAK